MEGQSFPDEPDTELSDPLHLRVASALRASDAREAVTWLVRTLEEHGFETWTVGGSVRDALRERPDPTTDWDFATAARPEQVQKIFRRTVPVGVDHGTVGVLKRGRMFEVTTFRRDVEPMGRRARVQFADTLEEDLARRDFTINAIAWHPLRGEVQDPFGGVTDLKNNVLRAVGRAEERFREDYLRILRGLRFAGSMQLEVDPATWEAMTEAVDGLGTLSWERVREEVIKVVSSTPQASATLALYAASGSLDVILPELADTRADTLAWTRTLAAIDNLSTRDPILRVAALVAPIAQTQGVGTVLATLKRLRFSNAEADRIAASVAPPFDLPDVAGGAEAARRWAATAKSADWSGRLRLAAAAARAREVVDGVAPRDAVCAIRSIRREVRSKNPLAVSDLAVDGKDLIRMGVRPGPGIGTLLEALLDHVLTRPEANDREVLLDRAREFMRRGES